MRRFAVAAGAAATLVAGSALAAPSAFAAGPTTLPNGFTAKVIAHSGQTIRGTIDATGYDLGIYIGPGVHGVRVLGARVSGANDEGILVQDTHDVLIKDSTVTGNTQHPAANLEELKGIVLTGTRNVTVAGNTVTDNGDGGIGVYDDGPNSSHTNAPVAIDRHGVASVGNVVYGNTIADNFNGCGIVVAGKNPGGGVDDNVVAYNSVRGFDPAAGDSVPGVGGIVVAGGEFGAVSVLRTVVLHNTIVGGFIPGISLHASKPAVVDRTYLLDNKMSHNGGNPDSRGIEIATKDGQISNTQVLHDHVDGDHYGVFHVGDTGTRILGLATQGVAVRVGP
jgi:parallel beta-helix repeat protein